MNTNLQEFNASKFVLFNSLLLFSVLYTLKLDGVIHWTWWTIFLPLWIWKGQSSMSSAFLYTFTVRYRHLRGLCRELRMVEETSVQAQQ